MMCEEGCCKSGWTTAPDVHWCLIRATKNMHTCDLVEKGGKLGRARANLQTLCNAKLKRRTFSLTPAPGYPPPPFPSPQECVQCIRDQGVSFIRHLGNIPSGRLTSPLRGARPHLQRRAWPPLTSASHMLLSPPHWHWGHVLFFGFFVFFLFCGRLRTMRKHRADGSGKVRSPH